MNCIEVELEVNKTKKLDVAVDTTGCKPSSNKRGPSIKPPPIPSKPAITPLMKAYKGNVKNIFPFHFISVAV